MQHTETVLKTKNILLTITTNIFTFDVTFRSLSETFIRRSMINSSSGSCRMCTASLIHLVTLKSLLVHPKDKQDKEEITDCVYKIPCASCEKC